MELMWRCGGLIGCAEIKAMCCWLIAGSDACDRKRAIGGLSEARLWVHGGSASLGTRRIELVAIEVINGCGDCLGVCVEAWVDGLGEI